MTILAGALDALVVLGFAAVGRSSHASGVTLGGVAYTGWPFLVGAAVGWLLARAWRAPASMRTGVRVWTRTLLIGMLLRTVTRDAPEPSFMAVAGLVLGGGLVGWRALAAGARHLRGRSGQGLAQRHRQR